jgi:hypothetical protein
MSEAVKISSDSLGQFVRGPEIVIIEKVNASLAQSYEKERRLLLQLPFAIISTTFLFCTFRSSNRAH